MAKTKIYIKRQHRCAYTILRTGPGMTSRLIRPGPSYHPSRRSKGRSSVLGKGTQFQEPVPSTTRLPSSADTGTQPTANGLPTLVASYDQQWGAVEIFYPGSTRGKSY